MLVSCCLLVHAEGRQAVNADLCMDPSCPLSLYRGWAELSCLDTLQTKTFKKMVPAAAHVSPQLPCCNTALHTECYACHAHKVRALGTATGLWNHWQVANQQLHTLITWSACDQLLDEPFTGCEQELAKQLAS